MSLRTKILLMIGLTFTVLCGSAALLLYQVVYGNLRQLEQRNLANNIARLDEAQAARPVANEAELRAAITEFIAPDKAAQLAGNAWVVTSGGAEAVEKTVSATIAALDRHAGLTAPDRAPSR